MRYGEGVEVPYRPHVCGSDSKRTLEMNHECKVRSMSIDGKELGELSMYVSRSFTNNSRIRSDSVPGLIPPKVPSV